MEGGVTSARRGHTARRPALTLAVQHPADDLDKELERQGHAFCRYADDCNIYVAIRGRENG